MEIYIVTFRHRDYAVAAFSKLEGYGVRNIRLASVPFSIKSECDLCIKVTDTEALKTVLRECKGKNIINNIYSGIRVDGTFVYKLLPLVIE